MMFQVGLLDQMKRHMLLTGLAHQRANQRVALRYELEVPLVHLELSKLLARLVLVGLP
jgi:hypothetical protein